MSTPFSKRRFITDEKIIREVLEACKIIHIGIQDGDGVYVVPTNYGYTYEDGELTFFTHGARSGRKWDLKFPAISAMPMAVSSEAAVCR